MNTLTAQLSQSGYLIVCVCVGCPAGLARPWVYLAWPSEFWVEECDLNSIVGLHGFLHPFNVKQQTCMIHSGYQLIVAGLLVEIRLVPFHLHFISSCTQICNQRRAFTERTFNETYMQPTTLYTSPLDMKGWREADIGLGRSVKHDGAQHHSYRQSYIQHPHHNNARIHTIRDGIRSSYIDSLSACCG